MQRQHLPLHSDGGSFIEPRKKNWHDLPWIVHRSGVQEAKRSLVHSSYLLPAAPSSHSDMIRALHDPAAFRRSSAPFTHAGADGRIRGERSRARAPPLQLQPYRRSIRLHYLPPRGEGTTKEVLLLPSKLQREQRHPPRNELNANQIDGVNGGGMDW